MIELKLENTVKSAIIDEEDFERLSNFSWYANPDSTTIFRTYAKYKVDKFGVKRRTTVHVSLANEIMNRHGVTFDHIDRYYFNNKKYNLREATASQNLANRGKFSGKYSSKYKGVSWHKHAKKWTVLIEVNRKKINLGGFSIEEEAASCYNKAAIKFFKEFACLNRNEKGDVL